MDKILYIWFFVALLGLGFIFHGVFYSRKHPICISGKLLLVVNGLPMLPLIYLLTKPEIFFENMVFYFLIVALVLYWFYWVSRLSGDLIIIHASENSIFESLFEVLKRNHLHGEKKQRNLGFFRGFFMRIRNEYHVSLREKSSNIRVVIYREYGGCAIRFLEKKRVPEFPKILEDYRASITKKPVFKTWLIKFSIFMNFIIGFVLLVIGIIALVFLMANALF